MKVVCDTNVLVSGILFGGHARRILVMSSRGRLTTFISDDILNETRRVLKRPKFKLSPQQVVAIVDLFRDTFELIYPTRRHKVIENDPDDDRILDAAAEVQADVIVSGDKHLRSLNMWRGIRILRDSEKIK